MEVSNEFLKKKVNKKLSRGLHLINNDLNTELKLLSNGIFGKNVVIVNGGFTTGLDETTVVKLFTESGFTGIENVVIIPQKQYCFIRFRTSEEAARATQSLCGLKNIPGTKNPLYIGCVNKVPEMKNEIVYDCPPGLNIIKEFITKEEEILLENLIHWESIPSNSSEGCILKNRQVRHFGYEFKYGSNYIDSDNPLQQGIPQELSQICQRFYNNGLISDLPDQLTVNKYFPGQGIPPHVDTHQSFTGELLSLSILGGVNMDFYCPLDEDLVQENKNRECQSLHYAVYLPPRSLCVMTGPSRYQWMHGICGRKSDIVPNCETNELELRYRSVRISFTFRKTRGKVPCGCIYPKMCDSQAFIKGKNKEASVASKEPLKTTTATELEKEHVLKVYEEIADHFSETRHKPWPKVKEFVESQPLGAIVLDVGCGNGKYLGCGNNIFQIGCDTSFNLLGICAEKKNEVTLSNCLNLPFKNESFDAVICIAVIHHLASQERREKAIEEIIRVLRVGGCSLVYIWALEQKREKMSTYLKQRRSNRCKEKLQNDSTKHLDENNQNVSCETRILNSDVLEKGGTVPAENISDRFSSCKIQPEVISDSLPIHQNRTEFKEQDMLVPWKIKPKKFHKEHANKTSVEGVSDEKLIPTFHRFYHMFKEGELESIFLKFPNVQIIQSYYDEGNWCIIVEKIQL